MYICNFFNKSLKIKNLFNLIKFEDNNIKCYETDIQIEKLELLELSKKIARLLKIFIVSY